MISTAHRREKLPGIKPFLSDFVKNKDSYLNRISQIRIGSLSEANGFFDEKGARELFYGHPTGEPQEGTRIPHAYYLIECPLMEGFGANEIGHTGGRSWRHDGGPVCIECVDEFI